jgi:molybdopterin converting factor small subunit
MPCKSEKETISITIRCYIPLKETSNPFKLGEMFSQQYPKETTLKDLIGHLFGDSAAVGLIAVNKKLAEKMEIILKEGDQVDIFPLLEGG